MKYTNNYDLYKPEGKDQFNIQYSNDNMDTIDAQLKYLNDNIAAHNVNIHITTDKKLIGQSLVCSKGNKSYTQVVPASMEVVFEVPETGTWSILNTVTNRVKEIECNYYGDYYMEVRCWTLYSAIIDHTILDPRDCITYADDAEGMNKGDYDQWYNAPIFKDIRPCILIDGVRQGYLDRNNFMAYENGNNAYIETYTNEVMIEFPRIGYKIKWLNDTQLLVSVTDEPNNDSFEYGAFSLDAYNDCDKIYLGAFLSCKINDKHYSSYGQTIHVNEHMLYCMQDARARGKGFQFMSFRQLTLVQCLYIIFFGDLNSQSLVGYGKANSSSSSTSGPDTTCGDSVAYGFMCESIRQSNMTYMTDGEHHTKCFGLEDLWGNYRYIVAGAGISSYNLMIVPYASAQSSLDSNWSTMANWDNYGNYNITTAIGGYIRLPLGDNHGGFLPKHVGGSATTLYADYSSFSGTYLTAGGYCNEGDSAGIFAIWGEGGSAGGHLGFRLAYYHLEK